jgi:cell division transport system permease protein
MGTEFRIFQRIIIETLNNVRRANWMNWVIISTMAAILSIFGCMFRVTLGIDNFVKQLGSTLQISVYLEDKTEAKQFMNTVQDMDDVANVELITKESAWNKLKSEYSVIDISNPLPDTLHIRVKKSEFIEPTVEKLKKMEGVESVYFPEMIAQQMRKIASTTTIITIILVVLLGGMTLFIISNTIHLLIQSCSREIEIMSMMGVTSWYIKTPYILQGTFYGLAGSIVALLPLYFVQGYIVKIYTYFNSVPPPLNMNVVILSILGIGLIVGASGSLISVQKYLKI